MTGSNVDDVGPLLADHEDPTSPIVLTADSIKAAQEVAMLPRLRRRWLRTAALVATVTMLPIAWSYASALRAPGTDSAAARTAEWMRDHHLGAIVNWAEHVDYRLNTPRQGGEPAAVALPTTTQPTISPVSSGPSVVSPADVTTASPTVTTTAPAQFGRSPSAVHAAVLTPPTPLTSPVDPALPGEGTWAPIGPIIAGAPGVYVTQLRPDAVHSSYLDAVVWFDPHRVSFQQFVGHFFPGTPPGEPASVPTELQPSLLAAFAGGFRANDSHGGLWWHGQDVTPLREGAATLAITHDGMVQVGALGHDVVPSADDISLRQNLDLIVDAGKPVTELASDPNRIWGFTGPRNNEFVWRSGVGVTSDGAVVWVGGPALSIVDLAQTLVRAGAVRAMQLDINQEWVQFNTYAATGDKVHGAKLLAGMGHANDRYLTPDTRDFVAVFTRPALVP